MYLWSGNKDTLYRIHGTNEPWTIGTNVSSGCIRVTKAGEGDLYNRTPIGAKVVVLGSANRAGRWQSGPTPWETEAILERFAQ